MNFKKRFWKIMFWFRTHIEYHPVIFLGILAALVIFIPNLWNWVISFKVALFIIGIIMTIYLLVKNY